MREQEREREEIQSVGCDNLSTLCAALTLAGTGMARSN
jgi:hypothetical protein